MRVSQGNTEMGRRDKSEKGETGDREERQEFREQQVACVCFKIHSFTT